MATSPDPVIVFLLLVLAGVALLSLALALRHRLAFRIAMRNVRRGGVRTAILVLGLLVGTTIICGSQVVGDTVNELSLHYTYIADGLNDESIYNASPNGSYTAFPYTVYAQLEANVSHAPYVAGLAPEYIGLTQVYDLTTSIPQTDLNLIGVNGNQSQQLGNFVTDSGQSISGPPPGQVLLDDQAASMLNASVGDHVRLYGPTPVTTTIGAIVHDDDRGGFLTAGLGIAGNAFVDLPTAQKLQDAPGLVNYISVTNTGSQKTGVGESDTVSAELNASLATIPGASGLKVNETLKGDLANAATSGSSVSTIFFVLGLFSIAAGALLIVGIFVMLAEERKGEMGMLRAVGLTRRELIYGFYFEGLAYSAGSALAGTALGVGVGYGLTYAFSQLLAGQGLTAAAVLGSFTFTQQTLVVSYVAGFLLTLVTVVAASWRASRLNIVRAIRDIPEPPHAVRTYTILAVLGAVLSVLGGLLFATTFQGTSSVSLPLIGGTMLILGVSLVGSRFLLNRWVFSAMGVGFLLWAGVGPLQQAVLGSAHTGGIEVVFVHGITMVTGALVLYIFNAPLVLRGVSALGGGKGKVSPVTRVALAYPSRQPTRTTVNLAIFSLVVFTLVAIATFGATVAANLENTVTDESGGYTFFGFSAAPIPDLPGMIQNNSSLNAYFSEAVPLITGGIYVNGSGFGSPLGDSVYAAPLGQGAASDFYTTNAFPFTATANGWSASQVMAELKANQTVALVDQSFAAATANVGGGAPSGGSHPSVDIGQAVEVRDPLTGNASRVTVIGILTEGVIPGIWLNPALAGRLGYHSETSYFLSVRAGVSASHAAQLAKAAFFPWGLVLFNFADLLSLSINTTLGFIALLQIFVGLGLAVGIAGMGILALRAVVERRREIGMLRASGFTQRMVLKSFFLEYSFITLLGIGIGTVLGLLIVYNLAHSPSAAASGVSTFAIPYWNLLLILLLSYGFAMAAVAVPSIKASRLPPAEAVRALE
ncbi:MAG: FtsX-like permease family protein [Thermoplasmata archaeon]|nr:FtsX-like permease family protein [Thermoplasmata archaeon]